MRRLFWVMSLVILCAYGSAQASTIVDFEDWTGDNTERTLADSRGFNFAADPGHFFIIGNFGTSGHRLVTRADCSVTMTKVGGGLFDINSLDFREGGSAGNTIITLTGFFAAGGSISQIYTLDGNTDTSQTFHPLGFNALSSAVFQPVDAQITMAVDNIITPEASTMILFASAALFLRRRPRLT